MPDVRICPSCGRSIEASDAACPYCGAPRWGVAVGLIVLSVLLLFGCGGGALLVASRIASPLWQGVVRWGGVGLSALLALTIAGGRLSICPAPRSRRCWKGEIRSAC